jgi:protein-tyrosine phosphatase
MMRDSTTDPLRIAEVAAGAGLIGMTFCPGKKGPSVNGPEWNRDLAADVEAIKAWRPDVVVSLMEDHEFRLLQVPELGQTILDAGLAWLHLPIVDVDVPDAAFRRRWIVEGQRLRDCLLRGGRVLIHCRGGLGRTGLVAAQLLVELGEAPRAAIDRVRAARPGAIETAAQERYVLNSASSNGRKQ